MHRVQSVADRTIPIEELIRYFTEKLADRIGRTRLVKLLYLADLEARRYLGRPLSSIRWSVGKHGPFDPAILDEVDRLTAAGEILETRVQKPVGLAFRYAPAVPLRAYNFTRAEGAILSHVVNAYASMEIQDLLDDVVYETEPWKSAERQPEGTPLPMGIVDNQARIGLGGVDLERVLLGEEQAHRGESVRWEEMRRALLDRARENRGRANP